jgi:2-dehydro-3-deoxyglucarate aldolase/4-hydroxy-2-oxoheptanedioate aldolase
MPGYFKMLLQSDRLIRVYCTGRLIHPVSIEMFGLAGGYDGFWIDMEHAGVSIEQTMMAALAARASGMGCFVRMPMTGYALVTQALESGVDGVMAAQVRTAAEAEQFVRWAKFAPRGERGMNSQGSDAHFTGKPLAEFARDANESHLVAIQIETASAADEARAIAAIDGVDLLFVGPTDLAQALGVVAQLDHPLVWSAIERVAEAARAAGKHWGIVPFGPAAAARCVELGCRMLSFGSDVLALRLGIQALKATYAERF